MRSTAAPNELGGRWAASPAIWLVLLGPASVLSIMQDTATEFSTWWALPVSAVIQHAVAGLVILGLVSIARIVRPVVPVVILAVVWILGGVARGVTSGLFVEGLSTDAPEYLYRTLFWAVISGVWMPLTVYTATQLDRRSRLLSSVISLREAIEVEHEEAEISEVEREKRLAVAVRTAISPVIAEIRLSLETVLSESKRPLATISDKIETVVGSVLEIVVREPIGAPSRRQSPPRLLAPLTAALTFDRTRPVFAATLIVIASSALLVPDAIRFGGIREAIDTAIPIVVGAASMAALLVALNRFSKPTSSHIWHLPLVLATAAITSIGVFLLTVDHPLSIFDTMRVFAIPAALVAAGAFLTASVGLGLSNIDAEPEERRLIDDLDSLRACAVDREEATREQFSALLHGPVLGRLSACVMALNFHAAGGDGTPQSRAAVAAQVISHLDLVTTDLEQMTDVTKSDGASR